MRLIGIALAFAGLCAFTASAQDTRTKTKEKTKIDVKDGKDVDVSGCVALGADGHYLLTNDVGSLKYVLVTDDNLKKYVGRHVEVKGTATDRGDAKVEITSKVGTSGETSGVKSDDRKSNTTTKIEGDTAMPYLGVHSIKRLSDSCK